MHWSDRLNSFVVTRHADIASILLDPVTFSSIRQSGPSSVSALAQRVCDDPAASDELRRQAERRLEISGKPTLINADPPVHIRQRKLVSQGFTPRRVELMEPEVARLTGELLDSVAAKARWTSPPISRCRCR